MSFQQNPAESGHRFKLDYQNLFRTTWKKLPHDVKFSGNSWSMAELLMERPQVSFDCLPEFVGGRKKSKTFAAHLSPQRNKNDLD